MVSSVNKLDPPILTFSLVRCVHFCNRHLFNSLYKTYTTSLVLLPTADVSATPKERQAEKVEYEWVERYKQLLTCHVNCAERLRGCLRYTWTSSKSASTKVCTLLTVHFLTFFLPQLSNHHREFWTYGRHFITMATGDAAAPARPCYLYLSLILHCTFSLCLTLFPFVFGTGYWALKMNCWSWFLATSMIQWRSSPLQRVFWRTSRPGGGRFIKSKKTAETRWDEVALFVLREWWVVVVVVVVVVIFVFVVVVGGGGGGVVLLGNPTGQLRPY